MLYNYNSKTCIADVQRCQNYQTFHDILLKLYGFINIKICSMYTIHFKSIKLALFNTYWGCAIPSDGVALAMSG